MAKTKLLIIDDEVEFASTLSQRLRLRGINTMDAHSGKEGLTMVAEFAPDVVILDLKMPDMNGLDVLVGIKKHNPVIEVIMLTGHGSGAAGKEAMEKGAFNYIMKPIDLHELLEKVNLALEKRNRG
ncbi:MAG: response regulator [Desulforhopalus sp.]